MFSYIKLVSRGFIARRTDDWGRETRLVFLNEKKKKAQEECPF